MTSVVSLNLIGVRRVQLALVLWKTTFFSYMQSNLAGAILGLVERERNGETIDHNLVKKVVDTFISLDINDTDLNTVSLNLYREYFEIPFLEATGKYYEIGRAHV